MTIPEFNKKIERLEREVDYYTSKVNNNSGFWQPDQVENWKKARYSFIKQIKKLQYDYPELML